MLSEDSEIYSDLHPCTTLNQQSSAATSFALGTSNWPCAHSGAGSASLGGLQSVTLGVAAEGKALKHLDLCFKFQSDSTAYTTLQSCHLPNAYVLLNLKLGKDFYYLNITRMFLFFLFFPPEVLPTPNPNREIQPAHGSGKQEKIVFHLFPPTLMYAVHHLPF